MNGLCRWRFACTEHSSWPKTSFTSSHAAKLVLRTQGNRWRVKKELQKHMFVYTTRVLVNTWCNLKELSSYIFAIYVWYICIGVLHFTSFAVIFHWLFVLHSRNETTFVSLRMLNPEGRKVLNAAYGMPYTLRAEVSKSDGELWMKYIWELHITLTSLKYSY